MKSYIVKYFIMGLIKSYELSAKDGYNGAKKEFREKKGDYPIYKVLCV